ncbi:double-strand break repair protein AddB [Tropicimonas sp.]|uniref:double-strand break repair protein AddB n=1 Tax=Tropicimonas sp. TaxID=2067044 RepID=UPI003A884A70
MADLAKARLFAVPCGVDYPEALIAGLARRLPADDPAAWARTTVFVNSGRMSRRLRDMFDKGPARLLPRIRLIADLARETGFPDIPPHLDPLRLRLDLARLLLDLIGAGRIHAPRASVFDLADGLAALIDEMHGEGVEPEDLAALDVGAFAAHWQQGRAIVDAAFTHFGLRDDMLAGAEARRRRVIAALADRWQDALPAGHLVIAGSTGSRGATRMLMEAIARLRNGYVVLPGFDFDQPGPVWNALDSARGSEDHPQFRFHRILRDLRLAPHEVTPWTGTAPAAPERNRLLSLALRPAPVTDQWRSEGKALAGTLGSATAGMALLEAADQRSEAGAIAVRLRQAVADGQTAALISPDRNLTRRVAASLQRWGIEPDDSAGEPLQQTAPGRFLRHVAALRIDRPDLPAFLTLLKHPLTASSDGVRGPHLRWTRELELRLRRRAVIRPGRADLAAWAARGADDGRREWADWLATLLEEAPEPHAMTVGVHVARHRALAERLAAGPGMVGSGRLWQERPGEAAEAALQHLGAAGDSGGHLTTRDYSNLLRAHLSALSVQDPTRPHPEVMIWGTLEARAGGADVAILAGLNEGSWPALPAPDTWLNRRMRQEAGLLSPDRSIGLAAHDFQQAIATHEVLLTRALRDQEAETVPSRWLNRLTNLLGGLGKEGTAALEGMRTRGRTLAAQAAALDRPAVRVPPAPRPSPCPPLDMRPRELAVTRVTQLIRDPYAIYASHILRLRPLAPLLPEADARTKGTILHKVMQAFVASDEARGNDEACATRRLAKIAAQILAQDAPTEAARALWHARLMAAAPRLIADEFRRQAEGMPVLTEKSGGLALDGMEFRLTARPDRIDRLNDGTYAIYDYKSGNPPSKDQVRHFDKQLPLEAALLERGGFETLRRAPVERLGYISLGVNGADRVLDIMDDDGRLADVAWERLHRLIAAYGRRDQGYTTIRAAETTRFEGDYDHLARFGEWDLTSDAVPIIVGRPEENG